MWVEKSMPLALDMVAVEVVGDVKTQIYVAK